MAFVADADRTTTYDFTGTAVVHEYSAVGAGHRLKVGGVAGDVATATRPAVKGVYRAIHVAFSTSLGGDLPEVFKITEGVLDD